jgi:GAF domain-containing protein/HAMP domain-containing protein
MKKMNKILAEFSNMGFIDGFDQRRTIFISIITTTLNLVLGSIAAIVTYPYVNMVAFLLVIFPFIIAFIYLAAGWLAWRGKVRQAYNLLIGVFLFQMIVYSIATIGYGLILGVATFVFTSVIAVEIAPPNRGNRIMLIAGIIGTLEFLLDYYGPQDRLQASGVMQIILPILTGLLVVLYFIILIRIYPRLSLSTKLIIPLVIMAYLTIGIFTAFSLFGSVNILEKFFQSKPDAISDETMLYLVQLIENYTRANVLLAVGLSIGVTILVAGLAKLITNPFRMVTSTAQKIASGKLNSFVRIPSQDEIGALAETLNSLATQLRQNQENLEQRVSERTQELTTVSLRAETRARTLEIVAEIGRAITTLMDLGDLLPLITHVIAEKFGYYHVGFYLLDPQRENLILRATNSEVGQKLLDQGYSQSADPSNILGSVIASGVPKLAFDFGEDAIYFDMTDFPRTRSEAAIPLIRSGQIVGVLDIQSQEPAAFSKEDIQQFVLLADQVALAIENAHLYSDALLSLTELQSLQRKYVQDEWSKHTKHFSPLGYKYIHGVVSPLREKTVFNDPQLIETLNRDGQFVRVVNRTADETIDTEPSHLRKIDPKTPKLAIPINLRGELIGVIQLEEIDPARIWSDDEITLVKAVAIQVGFALENARLLEETQNRAEREAAVTQITGRLRSSNDPKEILQMAINELREALQVETAQIIIPEQPRGIVDEK